MPGNMPIASVMSNIINYSQIMMRISDWKEMILLKGTDGIESI
jgi:hypothetical protein